MMQSVHPPFPSAHVEAAFTGFPEAARSGLLQLRRLIFDTANSIPQVGRIEETLKWGQPAYLTPETKSGSTIRLGLPKTGGFAVYAHCQTTIISDFRSLFPDEFRYEGNRAIQFEDDARLPFDALRLLIASALTYHLK
ncbi:DUF1801 domain-containing protein [Paracoccus xiamenensis]|uniref:DUF1801 domain-containing protein n=1 Tax=Paracoccus xiamenensis TaxID=2714901 RepID=UPI001408DE13|nr:DUF1801 domain-containing protein [Paracoccus xiamenensis]NHF73525.1 DUF1801 domain-containing protein [Paracoccus xiamenensis]